MRSDWFKTFDEIEDDSDGRGDLLDDLRGRGAERDRDMRGAVLSSAWARGRKRKTDPQKVILDLLGIRDTVRSLVKIHGVPANTRIELATLGNHGAGCATFDDIGTFTKPRIMLDKSIYETVREEAILDVYCGVTLHEADHVLETRQGFIRQKRGELKRTRALIEGLLEDERIENCGRNRSPGYAPYYQALKRELFEGAKFGESVDNFEMLPDLDKVFSIMFAVIRCPNTLTDNMKSFNLIDGTNVLEAIRGVLPKIPETELDVQHMGGDLWNLLKKWKELYKQDPEDVTEPGKGEAGDGEPGEEGEPGEGKGEGGTNPDGDSDGEGEAGEPEEGADGEGGSDGDSDPSAGDSAGEADREADGEFGGGETELTAGEIRDRLKKQQKADKQDEKDSKAIDAAEEKKEEGAAEASRGADDAEDLAEKAKDGRLDDAKAREGEDKHESADKKKQKIHEKRKDRFGEIEIGKMMEALDKVTKALDIDESSELVAAEADRTREHSKFTDNADTERRNVLTFPMPNARNRKLYDEVLAEVKGHVARMKQVFRFRLGTRDHVENEMIEGKLHRRQLAKAEMTNRIFQQSHTTTDKGIAICLLLDESSSMGKSEYKGCPAHTALQVGVLITEVLTKVKGVELEVYSFGSTGRNNRDNLVKYLFGKQNPDPKNIAGYRGSVQNYDHAAIEVAGQLFTENTKNENRLMIVLSDGQPAGYGYGGREAIEQTRQSVEHLRKKFGMKVMQVAIQSFDSEAMFGKYVVRFLDLGSLINDMRRLITGIIRELSK